MKESLRKIYNHLKSFEYNKKFSPFMEFEDQNEQIKNLLSGCGIKTSFFGREFKLPFGVAAGPLSNVRHMCAAMRNGYSVITWKTFRTVARKAHQNNGKYLGHNIVFVPSKRLQKEDLEKTLPASLDYKGSLSEISITNSFGMPSDEPSVWSKEMAPMEEEAARKNKSVITSVVGTPKQDDTIDDLAQDYAKAAKIAVDSGAKIIEANLSCPNVHGAEGSIYKDPRNSKIISKAIRDAIGADVPLLLKVGRADMEYYKRFIDATEQYISGIVAINTIPMKVVDGLGHQALPGGLVSGTCGYAIFDLAVRAVEGLVKARESLGVNKDVLKIVGCGGVTDPESFMRHVNAGAQFVMCATAYLYNPKLPVQVAEYLYKKNVRLQI